MSANEPAKVPSSPTPTADQIKEAIAETSTCSEAAERLGISVWDVIKLARQHKIKLNWSRDWAR